MILILVMLGVLALGLAGAVLVQRTGVPGVPDPVSTESFEPVPRGTMRADDLIELRFDQAVRGYRMSQVDDVLDVVAEELRDRDEEIARLREQLASMPVDFTGRGSVHVSQPAERVTAESVPQQTAPQQTGSQQSGSQQTGPQQTGSQQTGPVDGDL